MSRRRARPPARAAAFFDYFRTSLARLPAGLIRVAAPATDEQLAHAEAALGRPLPDAYAEFLRSFDGADLFHETVVVAGVGPEAPLQLSPLQLSLEGREPLVFATGAADERYALRDDGRVVRQDAGSDERALAGSSFPAWLDATVAAHQVLYGPDGEYAPDVFDPSGEEITPVIALRQAERALKQDPGAAGWAHARGVALTRLGRARAAVEALEEAAALDADNPWLWLDLGRAALAADEPALASQALQTAARLEPGLKASLVRAVDAAPGEVEDEARAEATALLAAIDPAAVPPPRVRLKVLEATEPPPRTPPPARPPRPSRAGPPRSGGRRPGS